MSASSLAPAPPTHDTTITTKEGEEKPPPQQQQQQAQGTPLVLRDLGKTMDDDDNGRCL